LREAPGYAKELGWLGFYIVVLTRWSATENAAHIFVDKCGQAKNIALLQHQLLGP